MLFICVLAVIAIFIYSGQSRKERIAAVELVQQENNVAAARAAEKAAQDAATARAQAVQDAAAERASFLARYVNGGFSKVPGTKTMALVVATQDGKPDSAMGTALASRFKSAAINVSTSFFKPEFVSDNLFGTIFDGSTEVLNRLELAHSLDALLLARETVKFSRNPAALDNVLTANVQLQIQVVPVAGNVQSQSWAFTANGAGFSQGEALQMAKERLIKQIASDTTMSLGF